jgi:hypothetical protein
MVLKFTNSWRVSPPADGVYINKTVPEEAIEEFFGLASKTATQGSRQGVLEHFKSHMASAAGITHFRSSSEQWAAADLERNLASAADNAPLFIEAFYDACASLGRRNPDWWVPDPDLINSVLRKHKVGYEIRDSALIALESALPAVSVPDRLPSSKRRSSSTRPHLKDLRSCLSRAARARPFRNLFGFSKPCLPRFVALKLSQGQSPASISTK